MVKFLDFKVGLLAGLMVGRKTYALLGGPRDGEVVEFLEGPPAEFAVDGGVYVFAVVHRSTLPIRNFHGYCFSSSGRVRRRLTSFEPPIESSWNTPIIHLPIYTTRNRADRGDRADRADREIPRFDPAIALAAFRGKRRMMK